MGKSKLPFTPFGRKTLQLAWEGWYGIWQLVHWMLPLMYPSMTEPRRRARAEQTLREFIDAGLIRLERFHFAKAKWIDVPPEDVDAVLSNDQYWRPADIDSWQIRFWATPEGTSICPGPPHKRGGWIQTTWWFPSRRRAEKAPTLAWTLRQVRRYIDREQSVYDFYWLMLPIVSFYRKHPDDPLDRLPYFWRQVEDHCWSTIMWRAGDDERHLRTYVGLWLQALQLDKAEWRDVVKKKKRPLDAYYYGVDLWGDEIPQEEEPP